jgi:hypothetical protein
MMLIAGTVPIKDMPLTYGGVRADGDSLLADGRRIYCMQGTGAMISAALATTAYLKLEPPQVLLAGDSGQGRGSREIYEYLIENIAKKTPEVLALHYWLPDIALMKRLGAAIEKCRKKPVLIADAASMYSAKAAGLAPFFDIFTPDAAEAAFLADPDAAHPAYVKFMMYNDIDRMPELIKAAYDNRNAAKLMLVKGATDYIANNAGIIETVSLPDVPAMEAIGGTGDTITGMVAAFVDAGLEPHEAAVIAARANRMAGKMAGATPATRVSSVVAQLPEVFRQYLCEWSGVCTSGGVEL